MRIRLVFFNVCFLLLTNCGDDKVSSETTSEKKEDPKKAITAKAIESLKYTDYVLSTRGEKEVANWEKYKELAIQIDYLKKADLSFFNGDQKLLKVFAKELKAQIPNTLKTNPIISRTTIIETTLLKLNENLTLDNIDDQLKLESVKEVLVAFSNLNYQVNKKLERDLYEKIMPEY